jgi:RNA polymerase primary sigma factor
LPVHVIETTNKLRQSAREFAAETGTVATSSILADRMGMSLQIVERNMRLVAAIDLSRAEAEMNGYADPDLHIDEDSAAPFDIVLDREVCYRVAHLLASLPRRSAKVMILRFGIDSVSECTLDELGQLFDLTRERIRQIEAKVLRTLRNPVRAGNADDFIDSDLRRSAVVIVTKGLSGSVMMD